MSDRRHPRDPEPSAAAVLAAQSGDARALEALVMAARDGVYRLSLRMTARPADAEDATQEILIKVDHPPVNVPPRCSVLDVGSSDRRQSSAGPSKRAVERMEMTFDAFAADLLDGLSASRSSAPDAAVLEREVQVACTHAMLTCLDRDRIAYILGDIFGVDSEDGGYICEISAATYRKLLSRARVRVRQFLMALGLQFALAVCVMFASRVRHHDVGGRAVDMALQEGPREPVQSRAVIKPGGSLRGRSWG